MEGIQPELLHWVTAGNALLKLWQGPKLSCCCGAPWSFQGSDRAAETCPAKGLQFLQFWGMPWHRFPQVCSGCGVFMEIIVGLRFPEEQESFPSARLYSQQSLSRSRDVNQHQEAKIKLVSFQCFPGLPLPFLTSCNTDTRSCGWRSREPAPESSMW